MTSPSAMPTRSAPSSFALALISAAVTFWRKISTMSGTGLQGTFGRNRALLLAPFEILQLSGNDALVAVGADPAHVPVVETSDRVAALARMLARLGQSHFLRGLFRNHLLRIGQMGVIVVADRADREAARTIPERADHAQQTLPEAEVIA